MSNGKPDKDAFFKALMFALLAFLLWSMFTQRRLPVPANHNAATAIADVRVTAEMPPGYTVSGLDHEEALDLGNVQDDSESPYRMHTRLSNQGAALASAWLTDYSESPGGKGRYRILAPVTVGDGQHGLYSFATDRINITFPDDEQNGSAQTPDIPLANQYWRVERRDTEQGQQAVFTVDVLKDDSPLLRIVKTYTLNRQEGHYALTLSLVLENLSDTPFSVLSVERGPVGLQREDPRGDYRKLTAATRPEGVSSLEQVQNTKLTPSNVREHLHRPQDTALVWLALANKFFGVIVAPLENEDDQSWVVYADAVKLTDTKEEKDDSTYELGTTPFSLKPDSHISRSFECYLGPKSKDLFKRVPEYVARDYVELINKDYYWCAFTPIVNVMLGLLHVCQKYLPLHNYGVAIIIMVLIVRTFLHPVTKKGQVNMTRMAQQMSTLQPKMEEIRKKYANDKQRMNQEIMKLYQENNINPAGQMLTCLPMMFQMPIWGALWAALNFTVELRHQPFVLWIKDLTAPDALYTFSKPVFLLGDSINLLPPLLGVGMWLQQRLMPKPATAVRQSGKTSDQLTQQRLMMTMMSFLMVFIFYKAPSGLTLYIMASNFFGLFEQHRIRKHLKDEEEGSGGGPSGPGGGPSGPRREPRLKMPKFWDKLQKMAEEARKKR